MIIYFTNFLIMLSNDFKLYFSLNQLFFEIVNKFLIIRFYSIIEAASLFFTKHSVIFEQFYCSTLIYRFSSLISIPFTIYIPLIVIIL